MLTADLDTQLQAERAKAIGDYAEIVARSDAPQRDDLKRLRGALAALGKSPADVEQDTQLQRAHVAHGEALAERDQAAVEMRAAAQAYRVAEGEFIERRQQLQAAQDAALRPLQSAVNAAHGKLTSANHVLRQTELDAEKWAAFIADVSVDDIRNRRRRTPQQSEPAPTDETVCVPIMAGAADAGGEV